jgi:hypothetical protein
MSVIRSYPAGRPDDFEFILRARPTIARHLTASSTHLGDGPAAIGDALRSVVLDPLAELLGRPFCGRLGLNGSHGR